jgi:hypothetical protein
MKRPARRYLAVVLTLACTDLALGQDSKSAPLAKQLASALDAARLDSVAAKDPAHEGVYVGALYIPGFQLLAISAKYAAPALLDARLASKEYRDVYIDLNSAATPDSRFFVEDLGVDGLKARREGDQGFDSVDNTGKRTMFDNEWRRQQLSEQDYMKVFTAADERYTEILALLLAELKKTS